MGLHKNASITKLHKNDTLKKKRKREIQGQSGRFEKRNKCFRCHSLLKGGSHYGRFIHFIQNYLNVFAFTMRFLKKNSREKKRCAQFFMHTKKNDEQHPTQAD